MAQAAWEKPISDAPASAKRSTSGAGRAKFLIGGLLMIGAVVFLVVQGMSAGARYFITVNETLNDPTFAGQTVRVSGAVIGETIRYDAQNLIIEFDVVNVPDNVADLGEALHQAVNDPTATRMHVRVEGEVKPDLLQHEAQAIMVGRLDENGVFQLTETPQFKCPSRFLEGTVPSLGQAGA